MSDNAKVKQVKTKDSIMMQAGVLVIAGFVSRIIGLLYRSPLYGIIGKLGFGYYSTAYNFYTIVLLISSYSIPSAISKVIAQKLAVKEYRNAHRIFLCSLGYVLVVGGVASLFLFFGAGLLVADDTVPVLRTLAPTIFIYGILGVLRGYFQAHKSMVQTSVSQILEQIANAVVSVGAAYLLVKHVMGTVEIPADEVGQVKHATYGAVGSALGTGAGVLIALLFMAAMYGLNRGLIHNRIRRDRHAHVDSYPEILKMITMVVTPFILNTAVFNLRLTVNNEIYTKFLPDLMGADSVSVHSNWGVFSTAQTIADIPIALATAIGTSIIPAMAQMVAAGNHEGVKEKIGTVIKSTMILSIPCAVGIFVLGKPLTGLLFPSTLPEDLKMAGKVLMALALSIVFCELSTLNSNVLQGIGKVNTPMINSSIALVVQTIVAVVLVFFTKLDVYGIAISNTLYYMIVSTLNQFSVRKSLGYAQEMKQTFLIPALASLFMGAAAWAVYEGIYLLTDSMRISVIPAVLIAMMVYFVMLLLMRGITEEELRGFPKGYLLVKIAKKCRLM